MNNYDVAHKFFYASYDEEVSKNYMNVSYRHLKFYSYSTCIAVQGINKNNQRVCLISSNTMTPTTGKHIGILRASANCTLIKIPFEYGNSHYYEDIHQIALYYAANLINYLKEFKYSEFTREYNRNLYEQYFNSLKDLYFNFDLSSIDNIEAYIKGFQVVVINFNNLSKVKGLKAKQRKLALEKARKEKQELEHLLQGNTITQLAYTCKHSTTLDYQTKSKIFNLITNNNNLSLIYLSDDVTKVATTKNVVVNTKDVYRLAKMYLNNSLKVGLHISCYTVQEITENYVQVGCHKIPKNNIEQIVKDIEALTTNKNDNVA